MSSSQNSPVAHWQFRLPVFLFLGAILFVSMWLGIKSWRIGRALLSMQTHRVEIELLASGSLSQIDPTEMENIVLGVRGDVVVLNEELRPFLSLAPYLGWLPRIGPTLSATPQLMELADAGSEAVAYLTRGLKPALILTQQQDDGTDPQVQQFLQVLVDSQPDIAQASLAVDRAIQARSGLGDLEKLPWQLRSVIERVDPWLPLASDGLRLAQVLPQMVGIDGPRRYLIIAQNEDELRPTGGFITGAGVVTLDRGRVTDFQFQDANLVDSWDRKPYEFPPQPFYDFMRLELFLFRDANFWPDFPTSAERAMDLYSYGQDTPHLDGAIAIDQRFLELLIRATGPISIPGTGQVINEDNVVETLRSAWSISDQQALNDWVVERKAFLAVFAAAILGKLQLDLSSLDPIVTAKMLLEATRSKDLQIYVRDSKISSVLDDLNWDGRVDYLPGRDVLMVVDTNMGYNKVNSLIDRRIEYRVTLEADAAPTADLSIEYRHQGPDNGEPCVQGTPYDADPDYREGINKCYWNYLRVYTPGGSRLLSSTTHTVDGSALISGETWQQAAKAFEEMPGLTTFANFLLVPHSSMVRSTFQYSLPDSLSERSGEDSVYQLAVLKQAGSVSNSFSVTIVLPENAQLINGQPEPSSVVDGTVYFDLLLDRDILLTITYR